MSITKKFRFEAKIKASQIGKGGAFVDFPYDVQKEFGVKGRVQIFCTIDGLEYRGILANMGTGGHILPVLKSIRSTLQKDIGDTISVVLSRDDKPRTVEIHPILQKLLVEDNAVSQVYHSLSFTKRKEMNRTLFEAKKEETRQRRLEKIKEYLKP